MRPINALPTENTVNWDLARTDEEEKLAATQQNIYTVLHRAHLTVYFTVRLGDRITLKKSYYHILCSELFSYRAIIASLSCWPFFFLNFFFRGLYLGTSYFCSFNAHYLSIHPYIHLSVHLIICFLTTKQEEKKVPLLFPAVKEKNKASISKTELHSFSFYNTYNASHF